MFVVRYPVNEHGDDEALGCGGKRERVSGRCL